MNWVGDFMLGLVVLAFVEGMLAPIATIIEAWRNKGGARDE